MAKYHINLNEKPGLCEANIRDCPFGSSFMHFDSEDEAQKYLDFVYENGMDIDSESVLIFKSNKLLKIYTTIEDGEDFSTIEIGEDLKSLISEEDFEEISKVAKEKGINKVNIITDSDVNTKRAWMMRATKENFSIPLLHMRLRFKNLPNVNKNGGELLNEDGTYKWDSLMFEYFLEDEYLYPEILKNAEESEEYKVFKYNGCFLFI